MLVSFYIRCQHFLLLFLWLRMGKDQSNIGKYSTSKGCFRFLLMLTVLSCVLCVEVIHTVSTVIKLVCVSPELYPVWPLAAFIPQMFSFPYHFSFTYLMCIKWRTYGLDIRILLRGYPNSGCKWPPWRDLHLLTSWSLPSIVFSGSPVVTESFIQILRLPRSHYLSL